MSEYIKKTLKIETSIIIKSLNSLMGIVSGIISDGELNDKEIIFLNTWCSENKHIANQYPANIIFRRVHEVLLDGIIAKEESIHLYNELTILCGNNFSETGSPLPAQIEAIFDDDPTVIFEENEFVFTGNFLFGTREACVKAVLKRGARAKNYITGNTNYLVVGSRSSPEWITENFGRKIQKAADMAQSGDFEISIIREADWSMSLK